MPTSSSLTDQLASLGIHLPAWPKEPEGGIATGDWIQRGQAYAEGVRLWRAQLRNAPESTKGAVDQLLGHLQKRGQEGGWDQLVIAAIKPEMQASPDDQRWQAFRKLILTTALTQAQLLGIVLEMARDQQLDVAFDGFKRLLNEQPEKDAQERLHLCAELIATSNVKHLMEDAHSGQDGWERAIALHEQMVGLLAIAASDKLNAAEDARRARILPLAGKLDGLKDSLRQTPKEVGKRAWFELLLNSYSTSDPRQPDMFLIESRSLPRSGHHYLKQLLSQTLGKSFSYCESYQEPGCCKASPCSVMSYWHHARAIKQPHLRLIKSHDFSLKDTTFTPPTGMIRLIQVRSPFDLLASWLELEQLNLNQELLAKSNISLNRIYLYHEAQLLEEAWRLIDDYGSVMTTDDSKTWLQKKSNYLEAFLDKWLPLSAPFPFGGPVRSGNYLLKYNDLSRAPEILQSLGLKTCKNEDLPKFRKRCLDATRRRSRRITDLIQSQVNLLSETDAMIVDKFTDLAVTF